MINGIEVAHNTKDLTGCTLGRLKILKLDGRDYSGKNLVWLCKCSCGTLCKVKSHGLNTGDTKSCGCLQREHLKKSGNVFAEKHRTHGKSGSREQKAWKRIKQRVFNENNKDYEIYSKLGMDKDIASDFSAFLEDIGEIPNNIKGRVSVDRKDNTKGYVKGNLRWSTDEQQARNKGMYKNNTSGVNGVYFYVRDNYKAWVGSYYDLNRVSKRRYFSLNKYGDELAFLLACEYRDVSIRRLNIMGAGYTKTHGKGV